MKNDFYDEIEKLKEEARRPQISKEEARRPPIPEEKIREAKYYARKIYSNKDELFIQLCALNLLNAAVKMSFYKDKIGYALIKGSVSSILASLTTPSKQKEFEISFYIDKKNTAYIQMNHLQFSFHEISLKDDKLRQYMDSNNNKEMVWEGVRLQMIAENLYDLSKSLTLQKGIGIN